MDKGLTVCGFVLATVSMLFAISISNLCKPVFGKTDEVMDNTGVKVWGYAESADGDRVAEVIIDFYPADPAEILARGVKTDENGRYEISLAEGKYLVKAYFPEERPNSEKSGQTDFCHIELHDIIVTGDEQRIDIMRVGDVEIFGTILSCSGAPMKHVCVEILPERLPRRSVYRAERTWTDENGNYRMPSPVPREEFLMSAVLERDPRYQLIEGPGTFKIGPEWPGEVRMDLIMGRMDCSVIVKFAPGTKGPANLEASLLWSHALRGVNIAPLRPPTTFSSVPAGSFKLISAVLLADRRLFVISPVMVTTSSGQTSTVTLTLPDLRDDACGEITGTISMSDDSIPLEKFKVVLLEGPDGFQLLEARMVPLEIPKDVLEEMPPEQRERLMKQGRSMALPAMIVRDIAGEANPYFSLGILPAGTYKIAAVCQENGVTSNLMQLTLKQGEKKDIHIAMQRYDSNRSIRVRLINRKGNPVLPSISHYYTIAIDIHNGTAATGHLMLDGMFLIENVPPGNYRVIVLEQKYSSCIGCTEIHVAEEAEVVNATVQIQSLY